METESERELRLLNVRLYLAREREKIATDISARIAHRAEIDKCLVGIAALRRAMGLDPVNI
ncbi:MAG: hypothetical protein JWN66_1524 [Sphingomonas bacterium]|jgi:hypothetical protein|uniref:hypothetical protein n=1 Tax=Sphingomonas bacterium TaxID=1895847 RepID=UPI0026175BEF|nr:hypothetical protein [Sphingomonas bacterium]MDB5704408.1 hypothetical protein [Sphingomonas bacterium]